MYKIEKKLNYYLYRFINKKKVCQSAGIVTKRTAFFIYFFKVFFI